MSFLDIILGLLLLWGLWRGLKNGLFVELASIVALVAGIYGAIHFSYITGDYLSGKMEWDEKYISLAAFILTFIIIVFVVHLIGKLLTKIADFAMLGLLNKLAGALFGTLKVAVILGALLIFLERMNENLGLINETVIQDSTLYQPIKEIGAFVFDKALKAKEEI